MHVRWGRVQHRHDDVYLLRQTFLLVLSPFRSTNLCGAGTPQFQCSVSYYTKGRAWQGFSSGYPDNHVWSAAPDSGYQNGVGVHVNTVHDNDNWH